MNDYNSRFQAYVAWVDHNGTLEDLQEEGVLERMSPQTGRNFHIGVFKLGGGGGGGISLNIVVPQDVLGSFKVPQVGDVVWIEESRRSEGTSPIYIYSTYNSVPDPTNLVGQSPVPQWGSFPGDYGHIRTHRDHNSTFFATIESDFIQKYVKSITGYRFRSFYRSNLTKGRFVVRGDYVFDIGGGISEEYLVESGAYLIQGGDLEIDKGKYPSPLNVPKEILEDDRYSYINVLHEPLSTGYTADHYDLEERSSDWSPKKEKVVLKNKDYVAYQPVLDKDYLEKADFERELPAAEEYQVAIRGNNKLLIQDNYGDGEQVLITLKNQYDAGFTIVHNAKLGQVRIRDYLGQGVLMDADPEAPRVISWTANRQVIEQGSVKDVGEFTYIRNGSVFGDSETSFGTKTGLSKDDVPNQEFLMVSTPDIIGELGSRLSRGMNSMVASAGSAGIYFRNNVDPNPTSQEYALYSDGPSLVVKISQRNSGVAGSVQESSFIQELTGDEVIQSSTIEHSAPSDAYIYTETQKVSSGTVSKSYTLEKVGDDTIVVNENISGKNTAISEKTITLPNGNQIYHVEDGSSPRVETRVTESHLLTGKIEIDSEGVKTTGYIGGVPSSEITQSTSLIEILRLADGLSNPINIGVDSGDGPINIGDGSSPITIHGQTVDINAP